MQATPKADIGMPAGVRAEAVPSRLDDPSRPAAVPAPRMAARRPPRSPARIASAAAMPWGHGAGAGKTRESNSP